jgi:hypothetical protein
MRPRLRHPLSESRQRRRSSHPAVPASAVPRARPVDAAAERVREAGGPLDRACYSCGCGYQFSAPVSTTVSCPHCGAGQAW